MPHATQGGSRLVLTTKSTNNLVHTSVAPSIGKDGISHKSTTVQSKRPDLGVLDLRPAAGGRKALKQQERPTVKDQELQSPASSSNAVAELARKLEVLTANHDPSVASPQTDKEDRRGHSRRGNRVLGRIKDVFSGAKHRGSNKNRDPPLMGEAWEAMADDEAEMDEEMARAKPKHGLLMGTGAREVQSNTYLIPRKPLPISKRDSSEEQTCDANPLDDPFADEPNVKAMDRQRLDQFGFSPLDLDLRLECPTAQKPDKPSRTKEALTTMFKTVNTSRSTSSGCSADVSHVDLDSGLDLSSSSPLGYSTPRIRLEPRIEADGVRRLASVRSNTTSLLGSFDFETNRGEEEQQSMDVQTNEEGLNVNGSLKRKKSNGKPDNSGAGASIPPSKKVKQGQGLSQAGKGSSVVESHSQSDPSFLSSLTPSRRPKPSSSRGWRRLSMTGGCFHG